MTDLMGLYQLAESQGVTVNCFQLGARQSISIQDGDNCFIAIDPFRLVSACDEKVKLAHELGHCQTGSFYSLDIRQKHENRADKWAIRQLVPAEELKQAVKDGFTEPWELAERFGVTEEFMRKAMRYYTEKALLEISFRQWGFGSV